MCLRLIRVDREWKVSLRGRPVEVGLANTEHLQSEPEIFARFADPVHSVAADGGGSAPMLPGRKTAKILWMSCRRPIRQAHGWFRWRSRGPSSRVEVPADFRGLRRLGGRGSRTVPPMPRP